MKGKKSIMVIYTRINTEEKTVTFWTPNFYGEFEQVEFDTLNIQMIINEVKETDKKDEEC